MQHLLHTLLNGGLGLPLLESGFLELDRELPKSEWFALLLLQARGTLTMSELARELGLPLSTATGIGARLDRRGLVERERDAADRRVVMLRLTSRGAEKAKLAHDRIGGVLDTVESALTPGEFDQLIDLIEKVLRALREAPKEQAERGRSKLRRIEIDE